MKIANSYKEPPFVDMFPEFTAEMMEIWRGNAPCGKGHFYLRQDGSKVRADRWQTRFGGGESVDGKIMNAQFSLNSKVSIFVSGSTVSIMDIRYSGKSDFWQWSNNPDYKTQGVRHDLEEEKIDEYLDTEVEDCLFWKMVQQKAKEIRSGCNV